MFWRLKNPKHHFHLFQSISMKQLFLFLLHGVLLVPAILHAQEEWPKTINAQDGSIIKIYEPTPESFSGNILKSRSAVSLLQPKATDPIFGTFWAIETVETDRDNRNLSIVSAKIPNIKFASPQDEATIAALKSDLELNIPQLQISLPLDQVLSSLEMNTEEKKLSKGLSNAAPQIIYTDQPSILVLIDGAPQMQRNNEWGLEAVVNSPFTIVKNNDGRFYLYGGKHWYSAAAITGPYNPETHTPNNLNKVQADVDNANTDPSYTSPQQTAPATTSFANIIVSTTPTELVQSNGTPILTNINGTSLSYVSNSENDIMFNQADGNYYVLLSGRWYKSSQLNAGWQYTASNTLPADFAKIPEGSPKDNVLASVAGTDAAREAVIDAQIPQTAKVDRQTATTHVAYDGDAKFENIQGTNMQYAVNTQNSVITSRGRYYNVDNGVWFESNSPNGSWVVCVNRPDDVDLIPPTCPVYNMKYVYIYDVQPNWVYMGYTPGYLNTFIYGATVVYGTGFHYNPWHGNYYFPRPYTYGFAMHYNPWAGWSLGFDYRTNWFHIGIGTNNSWNGWRGGWWGPSVYHPPFRSNPGRNYGYYGARPNNERNITINNNIRVNNYSNNIYNYRHDVTTINNTRGRSNGNMNNPANGNRGQNIITANGTNGNNNGQPNRGNQPNIGQQTQPTNRPINTGGGNNITTDRAGNVYQRTPNNHINVNQPNRGNAIAPNTNTPIATAPNNNNSRNSTNRPNNNNNNNAGQWQQRQQGQWKPVTNNTPVTQNLDRQQQMHDRGQARVQNFETGGNVNASTPRPTQQRASRPAAPQQNRPAAPNNGGGNRETGRHQ